MLHAQMRVWTLKECMQQAMDANIALRQQRNSNEIDQLSYDQSKDNRLPNLALSDAHNFNFGKYYTPYSQQYISQNFSTNSLYLSSSVILFSGLQYNNLVQQSKLTYNAGILETERQANNLGLNVLVAYLQILYQYEAVSIAQAQIDAAKVQVERMKKYVAVGQLPELNLLQLQASLAGYNAAEIVAENQLQLAKVTLMQLMEIPIGNDFNIERIEVQDPNPDISQTVVDIYNMALNMLPDAKSASLQTSAAEYGMKYYKGAFLPRLSLSGNLSTFYSSLNSYSSNQTVNELQNIGYLKDNPTQVVVGEVPVTTVSSESHSFLQQYKDNFGQSVSLNLSVPIFSGFANRNNLRKAKIAVTNAELNETAVKNQLRKSVEQAYTDQVASARNFMAAREQLVAEERAYSDMEKKFMHGAANTTDFLVEKSNYNKAQLQLLQVKYDYVFKTRIVNFYTTNTLVQ